MASMGLLLLGLLGAAPPSCASVRAPLPQAQATSFAELTKAVISSFGDGRTSFVRGHLHAGIDVAGASRAPVRPLCAGTVLAIDLGFPHTTVVVEHVDNDGTRWLSSYKHITDVEVEPGQEVGPETRLGRLFSREEQRRAGWARTHLHLELRHSYEDGGSASWTSMDRESLERFCLDPLPFLRARMDAPMRPIRR